MHHSATTMLIGAAVALSGAGVTRAGSPPTPAVAEGEGVVVAHGEVRLGVVGVDVSGKVLLRLGAESASVLIADLQTDEDEGVAGRVLIERTVTPNARALWASRSLSLYRIDEQVVVVDRPPTTGERETVRVRDLTSGLTLVRLSVAHADAGDWEAVDLGAVSLSLALFTPVAEPSLSGFLAEAWRVTDAELGSFLYSRVGTTARCEFSSFRTGRD